MSLQTASVSYSASFQSVSLQTDFQSAVPDGSSQLSQTAFQSVVLPDSFSQFLSASFSQFPSRQFPFQSVVPADSPSVQSPQIVFQLAVPDSFPISRPRQLSVGLLHTAFSLFQLVAPPGCFQFPVSCPIPASFPSGSLPVSCPRRHQSVSPFRQSFSQLSRTAQSVAPYSFSVRRPSRRFSASLLHTAPQSVVPPASFVPPDSCQPVAPPGCSQISVRCPRRQVFGQLPHTVRPSPSQFSVRPSPRQFSVSCPLGQISSQFVPSDSLSVSRP